MLVAVLVAVARLTAARKSPARYVYRSLIVTPAATTALGKACVAYPDVQGRPSGQLIRMFGAIS